VSLARPVASPCAFALVLASATLAVAQTPPAAPGAAPDAAPKYAETVQVTATRVPEPVDDVPTSIQVVTAEELRDRGVVDLRGALALLAGVDVAPGGDNGPASSVPEFWGLKEFDAFLLVVDGVPWGGAFNPALGSLDLADVDRIEVQRGPAPVMYGATSFVGVVQVVRRAPGTKGTRLSASGGSYGSGSGSLGTHLPTWAGFDSSLGASYERQGFADERTSFRKGHLLWRNRRAAGAGVVSFDVDGTLLRQEPASPSPRAGGSLSSLVPIDANHNPLGAHLDEDRIYTRLGYERASGLGGWTSTLSFTHSGQRHYRGFLDSLSEGGDNATGFRAKIDQNDLYADTHLALSARPRWRSIVGADYLFGRADAEGDVFTYGVNLDGSGAPSSVPAGAPRGIGDTRHFLGLYASVEWTPSSAWRLEAGARLNHTREERGEGEAEAGGGGGETEGRRRDTRPSGGVGVTYTPWARGNDAVRLFANAKSTFKPAAIDFNLAESEAEGGGILEPETAKSGEAGVKAELLGGALRLEAGGFVMDLDNMVVAQSVGGLPALANAGQTRFKGVETSADWRLARSLAARGSYAYHDARFRDYLTEFDGVPTQLEGKRLEMSPSHRAAFALTWSPARGLFGSAELAYTGSRYLNKRNTALAASFVTLGALVGFRTDRLEVRLAGRNLADRRDPVAESELGDAQYYRLFPRRVDLSATVRF
jgi:outer membrane receptor protein involved in Fe transport